MKKTKKNKTSEYLTQQQKKEVETALSLKKAENPDIYHLPTSKYDVNTLLEYFKMIEAGTNTILPKEKRRYVVYLRKSTDDEAKQVRSLDDQRLECEELARKLGIKVREEDFLVESASAKISGNRPIFDEMMLGFASGKYHGLLAWSPDRLSRNMLEAGQIIEFIDLEKIQDLHFKTYQFENTPNGKMMLGILFATSKQYSDKLSVDVKRGNTGNIREGKYQGVVKKGYFVDDSTGYFIPDGYNWDILREAVVMRLHKNKTNPEIAEFLNNSQLGVRKSADDRLIKVKFDKKMVGKMFEDPFYFGLYKYGKNLANLTELYDFLPLMTPDEYIQLNKKTADDFNQKSASNRAQSKRLEYGLLRGKVICDFCQVPMQFQHNLIKRGKNKDKWLISFYCRNKECQRYETLKNGDYKKPLKHSIRANHVLAYIEHTLRICTKKSKKAYIYYIDRLHIRIAEQTAITKRKLSESKSELRIQEKQLAKYQEFQLNHPEEYQKHHTGKLEQIKQLIQVANHNINVNTKELAKLKSALPTEDQFYELIDLYLKTLLNTHDLFELDTICNEIVANLWANDDFISDITLNPPYNLLVDLSKIPTGRGERTRTSGLRVPNAAR